MRTPALLVGALVTLAGALSVYSSAAANGLPDSELARALGGGVYECEALYNHTCTGAANQFCNTTKYQCGTACAGSMTCVTTNCTNVPKKLCIYSPGEVCTETPAQDCGSASPGTCALTGSSQQNPSTTVGCSSILYMCTYGNCGNPTAEEPCTPTACGQ